MSLATRLTLMMVALVALTAAAIGGIAYRDVQSVTVPAAVTRLEADTADAAARLEGFLRESRANLLGLTPAFINALALANAPAGASPAVTFRQRMDAYITEDFATHPEHMRVRTFRVDGRETARAERGEGDEPVRWWPAADIPNNSVHPAFTGAMAVPPGFVYTEQVVREEISSANGATALTPVLAMATPIYLTATTPVGVLMLDLDLSLAFALRSSATRGSFLVRSDGTYVAAAGNLATQILQASTSGRIQDDLPELGPALEARRAATVAVNSPTAWPGRAGVVAMAPVAYANRAELMLIDVATRTELLAGAAPIGRPAVIGGALAAVLSSILALAFARTMTRPLGRIAAAVSERRVLNVGELPTGMSGEIGVLARAVERYAVRDRIISESVGEAILTFDANGIIESINTVGETLFGYGTGALLGRPVASLWAEELHVPPQSVDGRPGELRQLTARKRDGTTFPAEVVLSAARIGQHRVAIAAVRDVSERHTAEKRVGAAEESFAKVFQASPAAIAIIRIRDRVLLDVNRAWVEAFGVKREAAVGATMKNLNIAVDPIQDQRLWADYANGQHSGGAEIHLKLPDGRKIVHLVFMQPIERDGQPCALAYGVDISEQRGKEAQLVQAQKMEAVGQLTGGIAHDFNNLLTVITGNAELLVGMLKDDMSKKLGAAIMRASGQGADLTHRLLAFSRRQTLTPTVVDANAAVQGMTSLMRRTIGEQIEVRTRLDKTIKPIFVDQSQLESAILNLAINARDAMASRDGGVLTIETEAVDVNKEYGALHDGLAPGQYVRVSVSDTGSGMPAEVIAKAFEPFFTTKGPGKGTGLGLSMVYGFVKQSQGHVNIYSEVGHGTTIKLYLPLADRALVVPQVETTAQDGPRFTAQVLLVEDQDEVRELAEAQLVSLGCTVTACADANAALDRARSMGHIDLLFTDMVLPGDKNGRKLADALVALRPDLKVLFSSGYSMEAAEAQGKIAPGAVLLRKPYRRADMIAKVNEVLTGGAYTPSNRA